MLRDDPGDGPEDKKVVNFKDLLSWKLPEHLSTNKNINKVNNRVHADIHISNQIHLYKLDLVT